MVWNLILFDEKAFKITTDSNKDLNLKEQSYVIFDIETTGLSFN